MSKKTPAHEKSYKQRLKAFEPRFARFIEKLWRMREGLQLGNRKVGTAEIYRMYTGASDPVPYDAGELKRFLRRMIKLGENRKTKIQGLETNLPWLKKYGSTEVEKLCGRELWKDFYHFFTGSQSEAVSTRIYLHVSRVDDGLVILEDLIPQLDQIQGFYSIKIGGPGKMWRSDTIVAYCTDDASRDEVVGRLRKKSFKGLKDPLPEMVKRLAAGIGIADEPPAIRIRRGGSTRHSFGSFHSDLLWVALRNTPNVKRREADGRHFLDNVLYCLRVLGIDPRSPYKFPNAEALVRFQALARQRERQEKGKAGGRPAATA